MAKTTFRREIRLGSVGNDCIAVKRALARAGFGDLYAKGTRTPVFGPFAVKNLKNFQKKHHIPASGVLGRKTFDKLLPWFDEWSAHLYAAPKDKQLALARAMRDFCKRFDNTYVWGGEHDDSLADDDPHDGFDCSSSVSYVLWQFGLLGWNYAHVAIDFEGWGEPGRGKYVTIHAAYDHVWIEFDLPEGYARFDTSHHPPGVTRGPRLVTNRRDDARFVSRHPKGL